MTTSSNPPRLGRCKGCDYVLFVAPGQEVEAQSFREVKGDGRAYRVGNEGYFARCPNNHRFFVLKQIKGTYSKDHKCDARCLNAKGHDCTCSCGGANHGRGHAVTVVEASAMPVVVEREVKPASDKQYNFMLALLDERVIPDGKGFTGEQRRQDAIGKIERKEFTMSEAKTIIAWLLDQPRKDN